MFKRILFLSAILFVIMLGYYKFWFLRTPDRNIPNNEQVFVSPANGTVVSVTKWTNDTLLIKKRQLGAIKVWTEDVDTAGTVVSIQLNVANVHYQRAPTQGQLVSQKYVPGDFNNAITMSNEYGIRFENEHNEMLMLSSTGKRYKVVQIAGLLARRIESYVKPGAIFKQGDIIGLIKLGSQVTIIFPHDVEVTARVGDFVIDGETILATDK